MTPGSNRLSCYGIPGDGCGGGREFFIDECKLYASDPITKTKMLLLEGIEGPESIEKQGCKIIILCKKEKLVFNLSTLSLE